jgi:hypothetical protein
MRSTWPQGPALLRRIGKAASLALMAAMIAGCSKDGEVACDSDEIAQRVFALAREQYPNAVSQDLKKKGSFNALERIIAKNGLDRNNYDQLAKAAQMGDVELKRVYEQGRYMLERVEAAPARPGFAGQRCVGRIVFLTEWGIAVKDVSFEIEKKNDQAVVSLEGLR